MRLGRSRRSTNIEDRRASPGGGTGMKFGIGTIVVLLIGYFMGINPATLLGLVGGLEGTGSSAPPTAGTPTDAEADLIAAVLGETEDTWSNIFRQGDAQYSPPTLVLFRESVDSACGFATAASGPFYCPGDRKVYIDLGFHDELATQFQAPGDFAQAYVLAHEVGHHVQNVVGTLGQVQSAKQRVSEGEQNRLQVRVELQADCYAGIWAHFADKAGGILEPGDIEEGLKAASAVGDDTIQRRMQGHVVPESFTHGSAEQRMSWFLRGYESGKLESCDTFAAR